MHITLLRICLLLTLVSLTACNGDNDKKSSIQEQAEQVGHQAAEEIKAPIDKAKQAAQVQEAHNKQIQETAKQE